MPTRVAETATTPVSNVASVMGLHPPLFDKPSVPLVTKAAAPKQARNRLASSWASFRRPEREGLDEVGRDRVNRRNRCTQGAKLEMDDTCIPTLDDVAT